MSVVETDCTRGLHLPPKKKSFVGYPKAIYKKDLFRQFYHTHSTPFTPPSLILFLTTRDSIVVRKTYEIMFKKILGE